jgi:hypothetical protein
LFLYTNYSSSISGWWSKLAQQPKDENVRTDAAVSIYIVCHIWKEKGRRIFQNLNLTAESLAIIIREEVQMVDLALSHVIV